MYTEPQRESSVTGGPRSGDLSRNPAAWAKGEKFGWAQVHQTP